MTKKELLRLLNEVSYADFFSALDENKVEHPLLRKLRKDFIHGGDNKAEYNDRCKEFVNFYLDKNGKLKIIFKKSFHYSITSFFATLIIIISLYAWKNQGSDKKKYTHIISGNENFYQLALRNINLTKTQLKLLDIDKNFYDKTYIGTLNKGDSVVLIEEMNYCYKIKFFKDSKWKEGFITKIFQDSSTLKEIH